MRIDQRWQVWLSVLGIFLLGLISGMMAFNLLTHWRGPRGGPDQWGFHGVVEELDLTAEQEADVRKILEDVREELIDLRRGFHPRLREIRMETNRRLRDVLTDEQLKEFRELTRHRRRSPSRRWR